VVLHNNKNKKSKEEYCMTLTKEKIIDTIYNQVGLSKNQSRRVVESLLEIIKQTLTKNENLLISGFGKFIVKDKAARKGRNPQTKEDLKLRARKVVVFRTSGVLRKKINH
jgi:integration host factor subunit alpha